MFFVALSHQGYGASNKKGFESLSSVEIRLEIMALMFTFEHILYPGLDAMLVPLDLALFFIKERGD